MEAIEMDPEERQNGPAPDDYEVTPFAGSHYYQRAYSDRVVTSQNRQARDVHGFLQPAAIADQHGAKAGNWKCTGPCIWIGMSMMIVVLIAATIYQQLQIQDLLLNMKSFNTSTVEALPPDQQSHSKKIVKVLEEIADHEETLILQMKQNNDKFNTHKAEFNTLKTRVQSFDALVMQLKKKLEANANKHNEQMEILESRFNNLNDQVQKKNPSTGVIWE